MMEELSMHILDLVQNSLMAGASRIDFYMKIDPAQDLLLFKVNDNGRGMSEEELSRCLDPFYSTKKKKVGLGLPLLKLTAQQCGGDLEIISEKGRGTEVSCWMSLSHIDRPPVGDLASTLLGLMVSRPEVDFHFTVEDGEERFELSTGQVKEQLGDVPLNHPEVIGFLKQYIKEGIERILKKNKVL